MFTDVHNVTGLNPPPPAIYRLPKPPSTNNLYHGRRWPTRQYQAWIREALARLKYEQDARPVAGPVEVLIAIGGKCDLDNIKAAIDIFVKLGVLPDDSRAWVKKITITPIEGDEVVVELRPAP